MTDPTPKSENNSTFWSSSPNELKAVAASGADLLLPGEMAQREKCIGELESHRIQGTDSEQNHLEDSRFQQAAPAAENALVENSTQLMELLNQWLCEDQDPAQPRLTDTLTDVDVNHSDGPEDLDTLGIACMTLFIRLGKLKHLYKALDYNTQAVELTPDGHPDKPARLSNLGVVFQTLFNRLGQLEDLHKAIDYKRQAVTLTPDGHPSKPGYLSHLGNAYNELFQRLGELEHLHMAVNYKRQAVALAPDGHPDKPGCLTNLGIAYETLFHRLGQLEHIHMAVNCHTQAVELTPDDHPNRPGRLNNLGNTHKVLFNCLGELEHIHMAVVCATQAVTLTPDDHPIKLVFLSSLGNNYNILFSHLGELEHLHRAIDCTTQAVALTPDGHPDKPSRLNSLGSAYMILSVHLGELEHINLAVGYKTQAVALTPDGHTDKPGYLNDLGIVYKQLFNSLGELEHLHRAVDCNTRAVALTPDGHPGKPHYLRSLGDAYEELFKCLGKQEHICMAVDYGTKALALTPENVPSKARYLMGLSSKYLTLFEVSREPEHLAKSKFYSRCAALSPAGDPFIRFHAAVLWASYSGTDGDDPLEAYSHCMLHLPEVVWLGTSVRRRFELCFTSPTKHLASDAAAVAILAKRYDLAVEWLEQGRCLVWGQMLQLRTPLDSLHASHPELADALYRLSSWLEDMGSFSQDLQISNMQRDLSWSKTCMQSQLADRRDKLIGEVRLKPGFDDFLRPPKASTLISHVRHGVAVMLTVDDSRCDAIIIIPDTHAISHVPLPQLCHQKAEELRKELGLCLRSQGAARGFKKGDRPLQTSFRSILATLWSDVVKPVLDHLSITRVLPVDDLPHITWCITGPLSFLPIHAAGVYDSPSTVLSNLAISSYTPTISSMNRSRSTPPTFSGILAVGHQSSVRGLSPLPGTKDELDKMQEQFANRRFTRLEEDAATIYAVVEAMRDHSWVHFACHGSQNLVDPMNSTLHLHDNDLSLAMISKNPMKNAQLAFLSACQTAQGDSELPNEAVHLAAGLLMAGYANVIATMWSIKDQDAPIVAGEFYKCLLEDGVPESGKAAKALHRAVKHLQDEIGVEEFARWVPYIHMGG